MISYLQDLVLSYLVSRHLGITLTLTLSLSFVRLCSVHGVLLSLMHDKIMKLTVHDLLLTPRVQNYISFGEIIFFLSRILLLFGTETYAKLLWIVCAAVLRRFHSLSVFISQLNVVVEGQLWTIFNKYSPFQRLSTVHYCIVLLEAVNRENANTREKSVSALWLCVCLL